MGGGRTPMADFNLIIATPGKKALIQQNIILNLSIMIYTAA